MLLLIKYHLEQYADSNKAIVECLQRSTYVDDVIAGARSETEAFTLYNQAKEIFKQGGFNLRKFQTNCHELQKRIKTAEGVLNTEVPTEFNTVAPEVKILGVTWNYDTDNLVFELSDIAIAGEKLLPTKRNAVSLSGRFYDPLGFLAPVTIRFKVFSRNCVRLNLTGTLNCQRTNCLRNGMLCLLISNKPNRYPFPDVTVTDKKRASVPTDCAGFVMHLSVPTPQLFISLSKLTLTLKSSFSQLRPGLLHFKFKQSPD